MAVRSVIADRCIGCGQCVKSCPADVFVLNEKTRKAEARYPQDCQLCMWCVSLCPKDAIDLTNTRPMPLFTSWG